jgi:hypothetical protein
LTAVANENASKNKRSTIQPDDIFEALNELNMQDYKTELLQTLECKKYFKKSIQIEKKKSKKSR